jgi:predicted kinase
MSHLYIIRGPSGAGKTTFAKMLLRYSLADLHYEADMWRFDKHYVYCYDAAKNDEIHAECLDEARAALAQGFDVVVSNTFVTLAQLQPYLDMVEAGGHGVTVIRVEGAFPNVHGVSEEVVKKMRREFESYPKEKP